MQARTHTLRNMRFFSFGKYLILNVVYYFYFIQCECGKEARIKKKWVHCAEWHICVVAKKSDPHICGQFFLVSVKRSQRRLWHKTGEKKMYYYVRLRGRIELVCVEQSGRSKRKRLQQNFHLPPIRDERKFFNFWRFHLVECTRCDTVYYTSMMQKKNTQHE